VKQTLHLFFTLDCNMLLESESFYLPVPSSDVEQTESGEFSLDKISHCTYAEFSVLVVFYASHEHI